MLNFKKKNLNSDLERLNQQIDQVVQQVHEQETEDTRVLVRSEKEELQQIASSVNALIETYEKKYEDLAIKHEIVTRLTEVGTWDGVVHDGVLGFDAYNLYNDTLRHELGYDGVEDFPNIVSSWYDTVSDLDKERVSIAYADLFENNTPYDIEYLSQNKDNSLEWVHVRSEVIRNQEGEVVRHIGTLRNIHESKLNQMKVDQLLERLKLIENSLQMSTNVVEGAWGMNIEKPEADSEKYWFSPQFVALLGYDHYSDYNHETDSWMNLVIENDSVEKLHHFLHSNEDDLSIEFQMKTVKNETKWFMMTLNIERNYQGEPLLLSGVLRDIQQEVDRFDEAHNIGDEMKEFTVALENLATQVQNISTEANEIATINTHTVQSSNTAREKLNDTIKVTDLIKDISDNTNLLGINASIEASLSGEEGNGFQVIAREIVKLSTETNRAVDQVEGILAEVSEAVLEIVDSVENITEKINTQATYSTESNDATIVINDKASNLLRSIENLR